jgi:polyhydroxybutyrate depolymerase
LRLELGAMTALVCGVVIAVSCAPSPAPVPAASVPTSVPIRLPSVPPARPVASPTTMTVQSGDSDRSIAVGELKREYLLHIPPSYDGSKLMALVMMLHGTGGSAKEIAATSGMSAKADKESFIVAYPQAYGDADHWNFGFDVLYKNLPDDMAFLSTLLSYLQSSLRIDPKRIFVSGFSEGGFTTYALGGELSDRIAAIAVAEASIGVKQADGSVLTIKQPSNPLPLIAFHGKADTTVSYNGGGKGGDWLSVNDSIAFWVKRDGCAASPQQTPSHNGNIIETDYKGCQAGMEVVLYTIVNGEHQWPTIEGRAQLSATDLAWDFFARHPKP